MAFEYLDGKVLQAVVLGGTKNLSTCRDVADKLERRFLADESVKAGEGLAVVCVPLPPVPPAKGDLKA